MKDKIISLNNTEIYSFEILRKLLLDESAQAAITAEVHEMFSKRKIENDETFHEHFLEHENYRQQRPN